MEDWCSSASAHHNAAMEFYTDGSLLVANGDSAQASFDKGDFSSLPLFSPAFSFASQILTDEGYLCFRCVVQLRMAFQSANAQCNAHL